MLHDKKLLLGVSGGIAAYKTANLVRLFKKAGALVQVVMTQEATRFITPLTLGTLSENEVLTAVFPENEAGSWTKHVNLGLWADYFVIAPATAQTIAKLAHGFCDSMLTAVALSARCPVLVCPAMDHDMYHHPATQANLERLRACGYVIMEPEQGALASGLIGDGRLPEPEAIFAHVVEQLTPTATLLTGQHVLITAGPTREALDPVRYLTNHSTGTMGFALAAAATRRGASVTLITGPTQHPTPDGVSRIDIVSAQELHEAVQEHKEADLVIMAAAVADYTPTQPSDHKIKKQDDDLVLHLKRTPDVLAALGREKRPGQCLVGFALETQNGLQNAQRKLEKKNLDWIVLNNPNEEGAGFGTTTNRVTLLHRSGQQQDLPLMSKAEVAEAILEQVTRERS